MKHLTSLILALILMLSLAAPALAEGKLHVDTENLLVITGYRNYGYCYARVTNTGDEALKLSEGLLEIYDEAGEVLASTDRMIAYPDYILPGESAYIKLNTELTNEQLPLVKDYSLTVSEKSGRAVNVYRLPAVTQYSPNVSAGLRAYNYLSATVTNDTDETVFGAIVVMALLDAQGNVLYLTTDILYEGITPGSSVVFREDVGTNYLEYYANNGIEIAGWDTMAYLMY